MWQALDRPPQIEILELGPGRGLFARDVLDWSKKKFPDFFAALTYTLAGIVARAARETARNPARPSRTEQSSRRDGRSRRVQREGSEASPKDTSPQRIAPETPLIVFANEFFDALPVEILSPQGKLHLALENNRLHEIWLPPLAEELEFLDRYGVHPEANERIEVPILAQHWIRQIARSIARGPLLILIIDYGYTRDQQLAGRHRGTLMAYRHHSASPDPYQAPGEQDLTAHVNFTALAAACEQAGMQVRKAAHAIAIPDGHWREELNLPTPSKTAASRKNEQKWPSNSNTW